MHVKACYIYPLKSGQGLPVREMTLTSKGPAFDRLWMIARDDPKNGLTLVSQRDKGCGKMALIEPILQKGQLSLNAPGMPTLFFDDMFFTTEARSVRIHDDAAQVFDMGEIASAWISKYLDRPCRLLRQDDNTPRQVDAGYAREGDDVSLADGFPLLITTESSLEKLQQNLPAGSTVDMDRFRPNIVLAGAEPFEEDVLYEIKIGDVVLEMVKPCKRCVMTTVDQHSGEKADNEPMSTLAKLRMGKAGGLQGAFFGQNAVARALGSIKVGDEVEILSRKPMHPALENAKMKYEPNEP